MLFNSYLFIFAFLPVVLLGFGLGVRWQGREVAIVFLAAASLVFYGWWNWRYVFLILFSAGFNYAWGLALQRHAASRASRGARALLAGGIAVNLGLLGYFKYANFFVDTLNTVLGSSWQIERVVLPLAVSFFTFEQITYLVDAYRGARSGQDFLSYILFVLFFPRLIAGPIVRPAEILPQFGRAETFVLSAANLANGLFVFGIGLFEKVILADSFGSWATPIFDTAPAAAFGDAWGAALAFTLQLYFDFAGYTDMAIGLAMLFNIRLPENFDSPYQAQSLIDFWRRWHMTLSRFLRDYLYVPLGGNQCGALRRYGNLLCTMLLGGLWHGASWRFVLWGGIHGLALVTNHLWRRTGIRLSSAVSWALTFTTVATALVLFRAPSLERARVVYMGMIGLSGFEWDSMPHSVGWDEWQWLGAALAFVLWGPNRQAMMAWRWRNDHLYASAFALLVGFCVLRLGDPSPFIYFQF